MVIAAVSVIQKGGHDRRVLLVMPAFFIAGFLAVRAAAAAPAMDAVFEESGDSSISAEVTGTIYRLEKRGSTAGEREIRIYIKNCTVTVDGATFSVDRMLIYTDGGSALEALAEGNRIELTVTVYAMEPAADPGAFDSASYYRALGIDYTAFADSATVTSSGRNLIRLGARLAREWMHANIEAACADDSLAGLLQAMVLGEKWAADEDTADLFTDAGIGHLMAISGLHITLTGMGVYSLLRKKMKRSFVVCAVCCSLAAMFYFLMTGEGTSANRAFIMLGIYGLSQVVGRKYDMASAAAAAAVLILLRYPLLLFQSGFLLSFGCVLALALIAPELEKCTGHLKFLAPGISIFLVTAPIMACTYFKLPVYSTFINLIVVPLFTAVAASGLAAAFLGGMFPAAMHVLLQPAKWILGMYARLCDISLSLPGSIWRTGQPKGWQIMVYLLALALFIRYVRAANTRSLPERLSVSAARGMVTLVLCAVMALSLCHYPYSGLEIVFLSVGQGDGAYVRTPGGTTMLIDCGSSTEDELYEYTLEPFLDSQAVQTVDYVFVSHGDSDHISAIEELITEGRAGTLVLAAGQVQVQEALEELTQLACGYGVPVLYISQGDSITIGEVTLACCWPLADSGDTYDENQSSMVLWLSYGSFDALFTGDLEDEAEEAAVSYLPSGRSLELLKVGHHGSAYATSSSFLEVTEPMYAVISCGKNNIYGHPAQDTLDRLAAALVTVYRTDISGAVTVRTDGENGFSIEAFAD